jgi:hypothetical protein
MRPMNNFIRLATWLTLVLFVIAMPFKLVAETRGVSPEERAALVALYRTMGGVNWAHQNRWLEPPGSECAWYGVICGRGISREQAGTLTVVDLELTDNGLRGKLPSELSALKGLKRLVLRSNAVRGPLPDDLLQRFDQAQLEVEPLSLVHDVEEVLVDVKNPSLLCSGHRAQISDEGIVHFKNKRCREQNGRQTREVYCEYREGKTLAFDQLGRFLVASGFFADNDSRGTDKWSDVAETTVTAKRRSGPSARRSWSRPISLSNWALEMITDDIVTRTQWAGPAKEGPCSSE